MMMGEKYDPSSGRTPYEYWDFAIFHEFEAQFHGIEPFEWLKEHNYFKIGETVLSIVPADLGEPGSEDYFVMDDFTLMNDEDFYQPEAILAKDDKDWIVWPLKFRREMR